MTTPQLHRVHVVFRLLAALLAFVALPFVIIGKCERDHYSRARFL